MPKRWKDSSKAAAFYAYKLIAILSLFACCPPRPGTYYRPLDAIAATRMEMETHGLSHDVKSYYR